MQNALRPVSRAITLLNRAALSAGFPYRVTYLDRKGFTWNAYARDLERLPCGARAMLARNLATGRFVAAS